MILFEEKNSDKDNSSLFVVTEWLLSEAIFCECLSESNDFEDSAKLLMKGLYRSLWHQI